MSYEIWVKDKNEYKYSFYSIVTSFTNALKLELSLKEFGCEHILCLGVKK